MPDIRLHDLRHPHATILLRAGVPVKVISERLGHVGPMITLTVYAHVMSAIQREAATKLAAMLYDRSQFVEVSARYHGRHFIRTRLEVPENGGCVSGQGGS